MALPTPPPTPAPSTGTFTQGDHVYPKELAENYSIGRPLGAGQSAKVVLATHVATGINVAVKLIDKTAVAPEWLTRITREVEIMKRLDHPNIIKLYEVLDTASHLCLVLEYASGGEMFDYLVAHGRMSDGDARKWFQQMLSAMHYCHAQGYVHRDLKAENILLDGQMNIKIADFGFANEFNKGQSLQTYCGSPFYASPEIYRNVPYAGPEVDMWALGCLLYIMVTSHMPFENLRSIVRGQYQTPSWVSHTCAVAIRKMLCVRADLRASAAEMLKDPWVNEGSATLMKPYSEPADLQTDAECVAIMEHLLGYRREYVEKALASHSYDHAAATYWMLRSRKRTGPAQHAQCYARATEVAKRSSGGQRLDLFSSQPMSAPPTRTENVFVFTQTPPESPVRLTPRSDDVFSTPQPQRPSIRNRADSHPMEPIAHTPNLDTGSLPSTPMKARDRISTPEPIAEHGMAGLTLQEPTKKSAEHSKGALSLFTRRLRSGSSKGHVSEANHAGESQPHGQPAHKHHARPDQSDAVSRSVDNLLEQRLLGDHSKSKPVSLDSIEEAGPQACGSMSSTQSETSAVDHYSLTQPAAAGSGNDGARLASPPSRSHVHRDTAISPKGRDEGAKPKPPSQRFAFQMKTTSTKSAREVTEELLRAIRQQHISYQQLGHFLVVCTLGECQWEMETCKIPGLNMHGIRFKRREGPTALYKEICSRLIDTLKL